MLNNPLIERYRYSTLRPKQFWVFVTIYIFIILLIIFINYTGYEYQTFFKDIVEFYKSLYFQFLTFEVIMFFIWTAYNSGSAIKEEILNRSFDFFRMLPLPAYKKALGILIGKNLVVLLFGAINLAMLIFFGIAGQININLQAQILLTLLSITILANLTSLLSSINPAAKNKSSGIALILLAAFFLVPMMIHAVVALSSIAELQSYFVSFFKTKIPILLLISFIALYFSWWIFKGILRRFTHELEPLFTRKGAQLFLVGYIFIAIGLYYKYIPLGPVPIYCCWLTTVIPILLIDWSSLRNLDSYIEYSRFIQSRPNSGKTSIVSVLMYSNLSLAVVLFAIWALSAIATTFLADYACMNFLSNLYDIFILFTSYLLLVLLLELYVVCTPASNKIGLLLAFVAVLYTILPLILSGIFDNRTILLYSPVGFIMSLLDDSVTNTTIKTTFGLMNALFCVFPAFLIWTRYNNILAQRQKM